MNDRQKFPSWFDQLSPSEQRDALQMANDLAQKITEDISSVFKRNVLLVEDHTSRSHIAWAGVYAAVMLATILVANKKAAQPMSSKNMGPYTLFTMLLVWECERNDAPGKDDGTFSFEVAARKAIKSWEAIMGKPFDMSWLNEGIIHALQD